MIDVQYKQISVGTVGTVGTQNRYPYTIMISEIRRLSVPPKVQVKYPVYVKTASDRYFLKIKSATEAHWLEYADSEMFKTRCTGFVSCGPDEYLDVEHVIKFCLTSTEKEYISRLKDFINHFEFVKTSLKL